jgi:hypothetical protein
MKKIFDNIKKSPTVEIAIIVFFLINIYKYWAEGTVFNAVIAAVLLPSIVIRFYKRYNQNQDKSNTP